jgi:hypothetical protein
MTNIKRDTKAQMLVLEAVFFSIMILLAIIFVAQPSPNPIGVTGRSHTQWKILADDALRSIEVSYTFAYALGDVSDDGKVDVSDILTIINFLYKGANLPVPWQVGDVNCDRSTNIGDVIYLINYLYKGGPKPYCEDYYSRENTLEGYIGFNWTSEITQYFNTTLPDTCNYNIYLSNGTDTVLYYNGGVGRGGNIVRAHRVIAINPYHIDESQYPNGQIIPGYNGSLYEIQLVVEYI